MRRNILIVEDNEKTRKMLAALLNTIDDDLFILEADHVDIAYKYAMQYTISLFILDVILDTSVRDDASGISFAEHIRELDRYRSVPIIFITALEDPKLYAYSELHCYQYIEKPYDSEKLTSKIKEALGIEKANGKTGHIVFRKSGLIFPLLIDEIVYIVFRKPMIEVRSVDGLHKFAYQPLKTILLKLDKSYFVQCNRNTIVNINYIQNIDLASGFLQMKHIGASLPLGGGYKKNLMSELTHD